MTSMDIKSKTKVKEIKRSKTKNISSTIILIKASKLITFALLTTFIVPVIQLIPNLSSNSILSIDANKLSLIGAAHAKTSKTSTAKRQNISSRISYADAVTKAAPATKKAVGKISKKRLMILRQKVCETLAQAIEQGGTTLKDFVNAEGKPGYFKQQLLVYRIRPLPIMVIL